MKIYKFELDKTKLETNLILPRDFVPLCVQFQNDTPVLYCGIDPRNSDIEVTVTVVETGGEMLRGWKYVDTLMLEEGTLVYHIFISKRGNIL